MACVSESKFSDAVGVTILKLNLTVEVLDRVDFGYIYLTKEINKGIYI